MTRLTTVAVIGAGRVGTAIAVLLERAHHRVVAVSGSERARPRVQRYLPFTRFFSTGSAAAAAKAARVVVLGVPDDAIEGVCADVAEGGGFDPGQFVFHLSGSVGLDALAPARTLGAEVLSLHPLQTIPSAEEGINRLPGSSFAVTALTEEGFAVGELLVTRMGGNPFRLADDMKSLYHAAAVFCSNYLVTVVGVAERLFRLAGVDDSVQLFAPLARASLEVMLDTGAAEALTGPAVRGDVGTVARNLTALARHAPWAVGPYLELAAVAADIAVDGGRLSPEDRERLQAVMARWR